MDSNLLLMQVNMEAGHGGASARYKRYSEVALQYAFLLSLVEKALHPELAKRIVRTNPENGRSSLQQMSALSLILGTRNGGGKETPKEKQQKDVHILDIYKNAASVKAIMSGWIDYLHMAKWNGECPKGMPSAENCECAVGAEAAKMI